jgi:hypothetical protein
MSDLQLPPLPKVNNPELYMMATLVTNYTEYQTMHDGLVVRRMVR